MEIKISVLNTNMVTNETVIKDFSLKAGEWNHDNIEILAVKGKNEQTMNEALNAFLYLCDGFGEVLNLSETLEEDDIEGIFPIYTATDKRKRKRGYIYELKEKDGLRTRIILIAPKNYLPSLL
jgi:hypothetical protein